MLRAIMSVSCVPFVKGLKALQVMPSLHRNFRACSVLMVKKTATNKIQKVHLDDLEEFSKWCNDQKEKSMDARMTPEMQKKAREYYNYWKKAVGLDEDDSHQFRTIFEDSSTQKDYKAKEDKVPSEENQSAEKQDSSTQKEQETKEYKFPPEENQSAEKQGIEKVGEDIFMLLVSGKYSDVTLQVGNVQFKAHRAVLWARCPVLRTMLLMEEFKAKEKIYNSINIEDCEPEVFRDFLKESVQRLSKTKGRTSNSITIEDCEPEVFGDFLRYLYNGSAQRLSEKNVFSLYRVANTYMAEDLKKQCLQHIRDTLSVETFCDVVRLAQTHEQSDLLQQAMDFATQNIRLIIKTAQWQNFIHDHPTEANAILIKALGSPS